MSIILGINLPNNKRGIIALTYIYGIGINLSKKILLLNNIKYDKKVKDWNIKEKKKIINYITKNIKIEGELRAEVQLNIKRLKDINNYRGIRHKKGLPLRGQRTKNNSRTRKGKRKTVANKKKIIKK
ncbi:MAG: 30S ribosomal protein S13 [Flavobacteriales endosymbiont of Rhyzopertha dominica]|nr:MAG: 30S ribosomal protein S13 [Candidatus Shikimatogenerans bostrichidophilus]